MSAYNWVRDTKDETAQVKMSAYKSKGVHASEYKCVQVYGSACKSRLMIRVRTVEGQGVQVKEDA